MSDVTIPAADAAHIADVIRRATALTRLERERLADLLDPPASSLRDDVTVALCEVADWDDPDSFATQMTDAALAVVRRHVEGLTTAVTSTGTLTLLRDDVLRMLDGGDDG